MVGDVYPSFHVGGNYNPFRYHHSHPRTHVTMNINIKHSTNDSKGVLQFLFKNGMVSISTINTPSVAIFNYTGDNITQRYDNGLNIIYNPTAQNISDMLLWAEKNLNDPTREEMIKELADLNDRHTEMKKKREEMEEKVASIVDRKAELDAAIMECDMRTARNAGWIIEKHGMYKGTWRCPDGGGHYYFSQVCKRLNISRD